MPIFQNARFRLVRWMIEAVMVVLIKDELVNPPTWFSSFRDLTLICSMRLHADIVIETQETDLYYNKTRGGMDFIADFVLPGLEEGIRIDTEPNFDPSIVVDLIAPGNTHLLYNPIQFATTLRAITKQTYRFPGIIGNLAGKPFSQAISPTLTLRDRSTISAHSSPRAWLKTIKIRSNCHRLPSPCGRILASVNLPE